MPKYNFKSIERKWQKRWREDKTFQPDLDRAKKPFYNLMMFPYPSAEGLHVGSASTFSGVDTFGRFKKLQGYDVFEPIGLDGFGIHSENYAMKIGEHIKDVSKRTEKNYYRQLRQIGNMHDWSRTVETYKPNYYKWTQWLFLQMYKNGLAYQKLAKVNWCPSCKTVLSDEQVIGGRCERCDSEVIQRNLKQWFFAITKYANKLLKNLDWIDWPEDVKTNQRNWIGKSDGCTIRFEVKSQKSKVKTTTEKSKTEKVIQYLEVFTTRPDTLFGATYMVVAPEHELVSSIKHQVLNWDQVEAYVKKARNKSEQERLDETKDKTGVELKGIKAVNPATKEKISVWVADYVLADYGTGAIMAVPAHDRRDFEFATKYQLPIKQVVQSSKFKVQNHSSKLRISKSKKQNKGDCFEGDGVAVNSGFLNDLQTAEAKNEITKWLAKNKLGKKSIDYKLRDWCISRQRYWGPPIPIVWCKSCALHNRQQTTGNRQQKVKVLMIHGFEGSGKSNWFPYLKKELEDSGCEVFAPTMSTSNKPVLSKWLKELAPYFKKLDENSMIIGHSLGSKAAAHLLERSNKKIGKFISIAGALGDYRKGPDWKEHKNNQVGKFFSQKVDWKKVDENLIESHFIVSKEDRWIDARHYRKIQLTNQANVVLEGYSHFTKKRYPFLREYISNVILKDLDPVAVPVPEEDLPVKLPPMEDFLPEGKGKGPLAKNEKFVKTKCPVCGGEAERETDVSDPFVDSAWYFFRYPSTEFNDKPFDKKRTRKWLPVDSYIGGKEHTVLHLLYSRFVTMVLNDLGHIGFDEPYKRFFGHGLITKDGAKMSKSKGNVINPDEMIEKYGADTLRLYLRFLGDFSQGGDWRDSGMEGMARFVRRLWKLFFELDGKGSGVGNMSMVDKTIKAMGKDIEKLSFNTAVARLMEFVNWIKENQINFSKDQVRRVKETLAYVAAPLAPHLAEEFWFSLGNKKSIFTQQWPRYDPKKIVDEMIELVVQVNGKVRDKLAMPKDVTEDEAKQAALASEKAKKFIGENEVKKVVYVPGRLVNVVV